MESVQQKDMGEPFQVLQAFSIFWVDFHSSPGLGTDSLDGCLGFFRERGMDDPDRPHDGFHEFVVHFNYSID